MKIMLVVTGVAVALLFLAVFRKIGKNNTTVKIKKSDIEWTPMQCPNCHNPMENGYSMAGRGIIWREKSQNMPGTFSNMGSNLDNTCSISLPTAINISWHCANCKLLLTDHSRMVNVIRDSRT